MFFACVLWSCKTDWAEMTHTLRKTSTLLIHVQQWHTHQHACPLPGPVSVTPLCLDTVSLQPVQREKHTDAISVSVCLFEVLLACCWGDTLALRLSKSSLMIPFHFVICLCKSLFTFSSLFWFIHLLTGTGRGRPSMTATLSSSSGLEVLLSTLQVCAPVCDVFV